MHLLLIKTGFEKNPEHPELFESYHPEYFAQGRTGGPHERQFCYTNEAFIRQVAQDARDYFDGKPLKGSQIALGDYFAVVPLDNAYWCQCDECQNNLPSMRGIFVESISIAEQRLIIFGLSLIM